MSKSITVPRIDAEDYFTTLEMELAEPIKDFDVLPEDETLSWEEQWVLLDRRARRWGKPNGKPRYKK
jgi:hypothetical protein